MQILRQESLKEKRNKDSFQERAEVELTELELLRIEQEQYTTELELSILELKERIKEV